MFEDIYDEQEEAILEDELEGLDEEDDCEEESTEEDDCENCNTGC